MSIEEKLQTLIERKREDRERLLVNLKDLEREIKELQFCLADSEKPSANGVGEKRRYTTRGNPVRVAKCVRYVRQHPGQNISETARALAPNETKRKNTAAFLRYLMKKGVLRGEKQGNTPNAPILLEVAA